MVRHYCDKSEDEFLCIAESRGDEIDCDNCICNEQKKVNLKKERKPITIVSAEVVDADFFKNNLYKDDLKKEINNKRLASLSGINPYSNKPVIQKDIISDLKTEINANVESMLLHQVLEEHIRDCKKDINPCLGCIRLGIEKGYEQALSTQKQEDIKDILRLLQFNCIYRIRGTEIDIDNQENKEYFRGMNEAYKELLGKLSKIVYLIDAVNEKYLWTDEEEEFEELKKRLGEMK